MEGKGPDEAHVRKHGAKIIINEAAALVHIQFGYVQLGKELRIFQASFHAEKGYGSVSPYHELRNLPMLGNDFFHPLFQGSKFLGKRGMSIFKFTVNGFSQGMFDFNIRLFSVHFFYSTDKEHDRCPPVRLVSLLGGKGNPFDVAVFGEGCLEIKDFTAAVCQYGLFPIPAAPDNIPQVLGRSTIKKVKASSFTGYMHRNASLQVQIAV